MSEQETYKGKLIPAIYDCSLEDQMRRMLNDTGVEPESHPVDLREQWEDHYYREAIILNKHIYLIQKKKLEYDVTEGELNPDGSISFFVSYYNGGTSFSEVMQEVMQKVTKEAASGNSN